MLKLRMITLTGINFCHKHVWKKPVNYQHLIHDKTFAGIVNDSYSDKYLFIHS